MSEAGDTTDPIDPRMRPFVEYWTNCVQQMGQVSAAMQQGIASSRDDEVRRQYLDSLTASTDAYLRSPVFLQLLKNHIDALIQLQQQTSVLSSLTPQRDEHSNSLDLTEVNERLARIEQTLEVKLTQVDRRLAAIEYALRPSSEYP